MIDPELRAKGIGASEIAAVVGIDHRRSAFDVYAEKVGLVTRTPPTARMRWGKRLERVIADCYAEETGRSINWLDVTIQSQHRPWQVFSPDAFVIPYPESPVNNGGLDCKNVSYDQWENWGAAGTDAVPDTIALQCQWSCSAADLPWWDVAALMGGNDLRIYRVHRDAEIEAILLEAAAEFWIGNVLARVPPPIESTDAAREYLRQRYPRNVEVMREADADELDLIAKYRAAKENADKWEQTKDSLQLMICDRIGDADGITFPVEDAAKSGRIMWKLGEDVLIKEHVRKASRRFDLRVVKATGLKRSAAAAVSIEETKLLEA